VTENFRVLGLVKFGAREHLEEFAKGTLYMNTLQRFIEDERCSLRKDSNEGMVHMLRGDGARLDMEINGKLKPVAELRGPILLGNPSERRANVFCMYSLREPESKVFVDSRNLGFGDTFALLLDGDEFLRRVKAAAKQTGHEVRCDLVEYVDESSYQGPLGIFKKLSCFAYQSEFRIALIPGENKALRLHVGELSDIILLGPLSELNDRLIVT
jgi:hypothetical protein